MCWCTTYVPDIVSQSAAPLPPDNTSPAWTWHICYFLVSLMVLASFVGNWLGISFRFGLDKKVGYVRGSLRDGDKAIRRRGAVVNRAWLKVTSFFCYLLFLNARLR